MSGILERIVRRRRASASSRLGPPPGSEPPSADVPHSNGAVPGGSGQADAEVNGTAASDRAPEAIESVVWQWPGHESETSEGPDVELHAERAAPPEPEAPWELDAPQEPESSPELDAPQEPEAPPELDAPQEPESSPAFLQRGRIRRRARYLRRLREVQLRDLGGFLVELRRFGRERPELVRAKLDRALGTDAELRALERVLGSEQPLRELREAGIGGVCARCDAVHGSGDRFCSACGEPLRRDPAAAGPDGEHAS